jgi:hypothetical protein
MTTVSFVTYKSGGLDRRVGPLPQEQALTMAKELTRSALVSEVRLEEWTCTRVIPMGSPA